METKRGSALQTQMTTELVTEVTRNAIDVSVVIPCLNEANSIAICVEKARKAFADAGLRGEVVVADNGSTDGSIDIAEKHGARVTPVAQRGYGSALKAGIRAARGAFIIMGDADDSYDFGEVPRFVGEWRKGNEVVMGNRFAGEIKPGAMPWHHKYIGNPGLTALLNLFFHSGIHDSHCGMRGFTREVFDRMDVRSSGMEFASEFVIKAAQLHAWASATSAQLSRWLAAHAIHATVRAKLAVYFTGWTADGPGALSDVLAVATSAKAFAARCARCSHDDFWRDFYSDGRADSSDRRIRESVQLRGAI